MGGNPLAFIDSEGLDYWIDDAVPSESGYGFHQSICVGKPKGKRKCISFGRKPGQGDCLFDCKGHVYVDRKPGPIVKNRYRYTDLATDKKILAYFNTLLGQKGSWDVIFGKNCRVFSENLYQKLVNTYGGKSMGRHGRNGR